ncbi:MAG: type II secretion system protein [Verrucomicrobiota bacterium]
MTFVGTLRKTENLRSQNKQVLAFTLIELLAVISIVGILTAILVPAVSLIRTNAQRSSSAQNLRQWTSALMLFINENEKKIPYEGEEDQPSWGSVRSGANEQAWYNVLPPYVGERPLNDLRSRDDRALVIRDGSIHLSPGAEVDEQENLRRPFFSYMMNSQLYSGEDSAPSNSGEILIRITSIENPSKTIFITETRTSTEDGAPNESDERVARSKGRNNSISFRFNKQTNVAFLDGHIATVDSADLYNDGRDPALVGGQLDSFLWYPWN